MLTENVSYFLDFFEKNVNPLFQASNNSSNIGWMNVLVGFSLSMLGIIPTKITFSLLSFSDLGKFMVIS